MEKKLSTPKKIDITSLKVIDKKNLTSIYGGSAAPQIYTSLATDIDQGTNCSYLWDIDN